MPALPNLVTASDLTAYGYEAVAAGILARASARVRGFVHQQITAGTSTVMLTGPGPWLLPQRPVVEVTSVEDSDGAVLVVDDQYTVTGSWLESSVCPPLLVEFDHGYLVLPDPLVELVCAIASRMGGLPGNVAAGARTEQSGGESVTWGVEAFNSASGLTTAEEKSLRRLFPKLPRSVKLL